MAPIVRIFIEQWQIDKAAELSKQGITKENLCNAVNIGIRTYYQLKKRVLTGELNRKSKKAKMVIDFIRAIDNGYCEYFTTLEQIVYAGGLEDSKMALEILSRRKNKEWGRKDYLKQEIKAKIKTTNKKLTDEEKARLEEEYKVVLKGMKKEIFEDEKLKSRV